MKICSVKKCEQKHYGKSFCKRHYKMFTLYGRTESMTVEDRFWAKVQKTEGCWAWTGAKDSSGYGAAWNGRRLVGAHRFSYEMSNGPVADGLVIDHTCHVPSCVRPDHLRAVTNKQNTENFSGLITTNTSGVRGVFWIQDRRKWQAGVKHHGVRYYVGQFTDIADAEAAVIAKRLELFTHNDLDRVA